jgi:LPS export ABC transporter protein LptC
VRKNSHKLTLGITLVVVMALAVVAAFYLGRQAPDDTSDEAMPSMTAKALMYLAGVRQTATKNGNVQWELKAQSAELEAATGQMTLKAPEVEFFLESGERVRLTGKEGILNTKTNNIEVRGNVQVEDSRYTLTTDALSYEHESRMLHAASSVRIVGKTMSLNAASMWYNLDTRQVLFSGYVKGRLDEELPL